MQALYDDRSPSAAGSPSAVDDAALVELYRAPSPEWCRSNFVSTLDGSAVGPDRLTGSINTPPDNRVFSLLRALADVVVVGAGTVRTEGYGPVEHSATWQALVDREQPAPLVVVSETGALPPSALTRHRDGGQVLLLTRERAQASALRRMRDAWGSESVLVHGDETVDLAAGFAALRDLGMPGILVEGGPTLHGTLWQRELIDELCLTFVPALVGGPGMRIIDGEPLTAGLTMSSLLLAPDGTLLARYRRG